MRPCDGRGLRLAAAATRSSRDAAEASRVDIGHLYGISRAQQDNIASCLKQQGVKEGLSLPLVGREAETGRVRAKLLAGKACLVAVIGESGIGKSALLDEVCRPLAGDGWTVVRGRCHRELTATPFHAFSATTFAAPPRDIGSTEATLAAFAEASLAGPVCVVVDDVQWADDDTVRLLHITHQRLGIPVMVASRLHPISSAVTALLAVADHCEQLPPLTEDALVELVTRRGGRPPEEARRVVRGCGGNPLLAELAADTQRDDAAGIDRFVAQRLGELSPEGRQLIRVAALLGTSFAVEDLAAVVGLSAAALLPSCDEAMAAGLLRADETALHFRHDIIREAVYSGIPRPLVRAMHRDIAHVLQEAGRPRLSLCEHYLAAAAGFDEETFAFTLETAREIMVGSPRAAAHILRRVLDLTPAGYTGAAEAASELGRALTWCGDVEEAVDVLDGALRRTHDPEVEFMLRTRLIEALEAGGKFVEGVAQLAVRASLVAVDERRRNLATVDHLALDPRDGRGAVVDSVICEAAASGDAAVLTAALVARYKIASQLGEHDLLEPIAQRAIRAAGTVWPSGGADVFKAVGEAHWIWADDAWRRLDVDAAIQRSRLGVGLTESAGAVGAMFIFQSGIAEALVLAGRWDDATTEASTALTLIDDYGGRRQRVLPSLLLAWLAVHRDDLDGAEQLLRDVEAQPGPYYEGPWRGWTHGLLLEARGQHHEAAAIVGSLSSTWTRPYALRLAVLAGNDSVIEAIASELVARRGPVAIASRSRAWIERDVDLMKRAVAEYEKTALLAERAAVAEDVGLLLMHNGRGEEAKPWLQRSLAEWHALGAPWDTQRIARDLRSLGVRAAPPRRRSRATTGWEALTEAERRVATLVASGLSNPEVAARLFVGRRTVTTHLSSAFRKLGVRSRTELAVLIAANH